MQSGADTKSLIHPNCVKPAYTYMHGATRNKTYKAYGYSIRYRNGSSGTQTRTMVIIDFNIAAKQTEVSYSPQVRSRTLVLTLQKQSYLQLAVYRVQFHLTSGWKTQNQLQAEERCPAH